jgi:25S rRNA (adenine2142-N1)-methyltransferase
MAKSKKSSLRPKSLSHGRPAIAIAAGKKSKPAHLSSHTTRTVIRKHHNLLKDHARAIASNDVSLAAKLETEIAENGGLEHYQAASILGQSVQRGGDTSRHLLDFLEVVSPGWKSIATPERRKLRMLDVGALSTDTAASRNGLFDITRIDLNSQEDGILQQDFMQRPLPTGENERFDIVCLSLVVNYVPDAKVRGDMLRRVGSFLVDASASRVQEHVEHHDGDTPRTGTKETSATSNAFPALWLVLPAPCVTNSRYLTSSRLVQIVTSMGYVLIQEKLSAKLAYYLFKWTGNGKRQAFPKMEVNPGKARNNFVVLVG